MIKIDNREIYTSSNEKIKGRIIPDFQNLVVTTPYITGQELAPLATDPIFKDTNLDPLAGKTASFYLRVPSVKDDEMVEGECKISVLTPLLEAPIPFIDDIDEKI